MRDLNLETITDTMSWYKISPLNGYNLIRVKTKIVGNEVEPSQKPKVFYTDKSLEFGTSCDELSWNHQTSTPHRSETNGIAERAARQVKEVVRFHGQILLSANTKMEAQYSYQLPQIPKRIGKTNVWLFGCRREQKSFKVMDEFHKIFVFERNSFERGSVCRRCLPRETESMCKKIFHPKQCKQWTRNEWRSYSGTQNNHEESPLWCIDGHPWIHKYMYAPEKCSKEQYYFLTWEIIWDLMNLYISKGFLLFIILARMKNRKWEAHEPWQKHHFVTKELNKKGRYIYIYTTRLFPDEFWWFVDGELRFKIAQERRELR